jgi:hypothetical protein
MHLGENEIRFSHCERNMQRAFSSRLASLSFRGMSEFIPASLETSGCWRNMISIRWDCYSLSRTLRNLQEIRSVIIKPASTSETWIDLYHITRRNASAFIFLLATVRTLNLTQYIIHLIIYSSRPRACNLRNFRLQETRRIRALPQGHDINRFHNAK